MNASELNLLVVDDDDFQRQMIVNMLHTLGATSVSDASDGRQAIEMIREAKGGVADIVLCDLNMPEMDGLEFLRHLGEEGHNVAIIIVSALGGKLLLSAGKMAKMHGIKLLGVIEKPILLGQLESLLAQYERTENKWLQSVATVDVMLEEVLYGIQAGQFEPYFQPKVDLKTGRVVGAEALARWLHPEKGVIGPNVFIPKLEQSGNIGDLTFQMLEKSAMACRSLHEEGCPISISVNLSQVSLDDADLADKVTRIIGKVGIDPQYIVLEVTESAAMNDMAHSLENLARLCMKGFPLSIDDYGTGYSSLQQLMRIPFSELKIDQSFVKDFSDSDALRIVVESSIEMARKLEIKSIAEGVESQREWDMLKRLGCDMVQGYFVAKPMDMATFFKFCKAAPSGKQL